MSNFLDRTDGIFYSAPPTVFDPVTGYRWLPRTRIMALSKGELIYENRVSFNNWGYYSKYDYHPEKASPRAYRIIVLGDSFTNCLCMPRTWPESLQEVLNSRPDHGRDVEVYAFPTDGGGILNWHSVFMRQVVPNFEFDALVLGDTVNDGGNKFIVSHSTDEGAYIGFFDYDKRPVSQEDFKRVFPEMTRYYDIVPEPVMDEMAKRAKERKPVTSPTVAHYLANVNDDAMGVTPEAAADTAALTAWYGEQRIGMLREMVDTCKQRGVPVIYYSMPGRIPLLWWKKRRAMLRQQACAAAIARILGIQYFDGYNAFRDVTSKEIVDLLWLKYDGHWTLPAADLFALKIACWMTRKRFIS